MGNSQDEKSIISMFQSLTNVLNTTVIVTSTQYQWYQYQVQQRPIPSIISAICHHPPFSVYCACNSICIPSPFSTTLSPSTNILSQSITFGWELLVLELKTTPKKQTTKNLEAEHLKAKTALLYKVTSIQVTNLQLLA